jgi:histone deacetylase 1/2
LLTPIFIQQPEGFVKPGSDKNKVCMLNKAIYGLKQAGRAWQHSLFDVIKMQNFKQFMKEPCIWFKEKDKKLTLIGAYVDDTLITGDDRKDIEEISTTLPKAFRMKHMGELSEFLGIEAVYINDGIKLCQRKFAKQVAQQFEQLNCKTQETQWRKDTNQAKMMKSEMITRSGKRLDA